VHKGLLLTFHKTGLRPLLWKYYKTVTKYAYAMWYTIIFYFPSSFSLKHISLCCQDTELLYTYHHITLQKHCTVLLSCCLLAYHRRHLKHISAFVFKFNACVMWYSALHNLASTFLSIFSSD
jgi:hypothetical protein